MTDRRYILGGIGAVFATLWASQAEAARKKKRATARKRSAGKSAKKQAPKPVAPAAPPVPAVTAPETLAALNGTFDTILNELLVWSPLSATGAGYDKGALATQKHRIDDRSEAGRESARVRLLSAVNALRAIDRNRLAAAERVHYDSVLWDYESQLAGVSSFDFGDQATGVNNAFYSPTPYVVSQLTGIYAFVPDFLETQHSIETRADADAYVARLHGFAAALDQETLRVTEDAARGYAPPDFILDIALKQLSGIRDTPAAQSGMRSSLVRRTTEKGIAVDWDTKVTAAIDGPVRQALARQAEALEKARAHSRAEAGVRWLPQGESYYSWAVRQSTSTSLSARDIHAVGLEKVAQISAEMDVRLRALGFTQGTVGERVAALGADPRYLYPNTDAGKAQLLSDLNGKVAAINARLPQYFGVLPKTQASIRRIPEATEAGAPGGYYMPPALDGSRPGAYYINLRDTAEQPKFSLSTLTYHEAVPGHHMQISIQQESDAIPTLRKMTNFNAYVEGWALYSEQLAEEMGMYEDDAVGRIGYLNDALFRAVRLVVDTGLHAQGWSRAQAIAYMKDKTGDGKETEIDRYCVWPGQALGYMIGKIEWLRLRETMKRKQGSRFDIKAFHDTGLLVGSVPLATLEQVYKDRNLI